MQHVKFQAGGKKHANIASFFWSKRAAFSSNVKKHCNACIETLALRDIKNDFNHKRVF